MSKLRRSTHVRVSYYDFKLIERIINQLIEKCPKCKTPSKGAAITYALEFTLGIVEEEKSEEELVNIFD